MRLTTQFRNRAIECLNRAEGALTLEIRAYWTEMAQLWHNLATHLEETRGYPQDSTVFAPPDSPAVDERSRPRPH